MSPARTPWRWARPFRGLGRRDCRPHGSQHTGPALTPGSPILSWEELPVSERPAGAGWGAARPRGRGRSPALCRTQISPPQHQPRGPTSGPRPADQLHPSSKLYPELSRTGFHPQVESQRSTPRRPTVTLNASLPLPLTPQPGARPTGLANGPGACRATPLPERARTGGAAALPRKIPLENPGVGAGRGNSGSREPGAPTCKLSGRPRRRRHLSHRKNGFKSLRAVAVAAALSSSGAGTSAPSFPAPFLPHRSRLARGAVAMATPPAIRRWDFRTRSSRSRGARRAVAMATFPGVAQPPGGLSSLTVRRRRFPG